MQAAGQSASAAGWRNSNGFPASLEVHVGVHKDLLEDVAAEIPGDLLSLEAVVKKIEVIRLFMDHDLHAKFRVDSGHRRADCVVS